MLSRVPKKVAKRWKVARELNAIRAHLQSIKKIRPSIGVESHRLDSLCRLIANEVDDLERGLK